MEDLGQYSLYLGPCKHTFLRLKKWFGLKELAADLSSSILAMMGRNGEPDDETTPGRAGLGGAAAVVCGFGRDLAKGDGGVLEGEAMSGAGSDAVSEEGGRGVGRGVTERVGGGELGEFERMEDTEGTGAGSGLGGRGADSRDITVGAVDGWRGCLGGESGIASAAGAGLGVGAEAVGVVGADGTGEETIEREGDSERREAVTTESRDAGAVWYSVKREVSGAALCCMKGEWAPCLREEMGERSPQRAFSRRRASREGWAREGSVGVEGMRDMMEEIGGSEGRF